MKEKNDKNILNFIFEAGLLKRMPRSGWQVLGIKSPESVADHSFRCAVIAYCLAKMEKADTAKSVLMALMNDMHEARICDLHKMAQQYFDYKSAETKAFYEQVSALPKTIKGELLDLHNEYQKQKSTTSTIARDADILECLIQAREYEQQGSVDAQKFMKRAPHFLKTKSARRLWRLCKTTDPNCWWENLSEFKR